MNHLDELKSLIKGEVYFDNLHRIIYSTDASDYSERPIGVAYPKDYEDIRQILKYCYTNNIPLIPRGGGTSLAGQVLGNGLIIDTSRYLDKILEINQAEKYCWVEPGVVPDVLNLALKDYGLFWGPETSTSNRNTIGGMVGNNSCGSHFPIYGNTREHLLEIKGFLADGTEVHFHPINSIDEIPKNCKEYEIISTLINYLSSKELQKKIEDVFPKKSIRRRNHGYAVDELINSNLLTNGNKAFNLSKLIAGSEGTLVFATQIKLNLVEAPPQFIGVVAAHFHSLYEALKANIIAIENGATASELIDETIIELTKENPTQAKNRFFIEGNPKAILIMEQNAYSQEELDNKLEILIEILKKSNLGYHYPIIKGNQINQIWELRKAGLGLLSNITRDERSVTVIEDTAVDIYDLPDYTTELIDKMKEIGVQIITYAHAGSGELHFHPIINLKTQNGVELYRKVLWETAKVLKKYKGSLSGEHGDGRLRSELIPFMYGEEIYELFKKIKYLFDPKGILNPGKIIDPPPMNSNLRFDHKTHIPVITTYFDYSKDNGFAHAIERCNGSADCRKPAIFAGVMCPSYKATLNEKDSTRARANTLREIIINSTKTNPFDSEELREVMELCLSCKACKSECPSNVDITKYKAEFLQHYYDENGTPLNALLIGYMPKILNLLSSVSKISNWLFSNQISKNVIFTILDFHKNRSIPLLPETTLLSWWQLNHQSNNNKPKVYFFADEFTNTTDAQIGVKAIKLLEYFGYEVEIPKHLESGRTFLSNGLLKKAKKIAVENIELLSKLISEKTPLIGIEPSTILTFRDEYPELVPEELRSKARKIAENSLLFDEFVVNYLPNETKINIKRKIDKKDIKLHLHTHCYQKSLADPNTLSRMIEELTPYLVNQISSTCCGMAGSFGMERKKYDVSIKIANLHLVPYINKLSENDLVLANGTSCRHQIEELTNKKPLHPIEFLYNVIFEHNI